MRNYFDLTPIKDRLKALPEPARWKAESDYGSYLVFYDYETPKFFMIADNIYQEEDNGKALAEFIAHSPTDIADLLAYVEYLREQLALLDPCGSRSHGRKT